MAADFFTKSLPVSKVESFRTVLTGTDSTQSPQVSVGVLECGSNYILELSGIIKNVQLTRLQRQEQIDFYHKAYMNESSRIGA